MFSFTISFIEFLIPDFSHEIARKPYETSSSLEWQHDWYFGSLLQLNNAREFEEARSSFFIETISIH